MMTEERNGVWGETGTPTDLWAAPKSLAFAGPEEAREAWGKTVDALEGLCVVAEGVGLEPLLLAVVDAKARAEEELARAADAATRPEGADISEGEERRLVALVRRSDALNAACAAVEDWSAAEDARRDALEVLAEMRAEAHHNFEVYRRELGLSG